MKKNEKIVEELWKEKAELQRKIENAKNRLEKAPQGSVRVVKHRQGVQFYRRMDPEDRNGLYMPVSEKRTAIALIQKKYDQQFIHAATRQMKQIDDFLKKYDPSVLERIYQSTPENSREFLSLAVLPDNVFAERWQNMTYDSKPFSEGIPEHFTSKGERVRSKSEVMIANALTAAGVPYRYECPLQLGSTLVYPDFTILRMTDRQEVYWEHFGLIDDTEYRNKALQKVRQYEKSGIFPGDRLILTAESYKFPINLEVINNHMQYFLGKK